MAWVKNRNKLVSSQGNSLRGAALDILEAGLEAIETKGAVVRSIKLEGDKLLVKDRSFDIAPDGRLLVVAVGKCALDAAVSLENILGGRLTGGVAVDVREDPSCPTVKIKCLTGDHPFPSERNVNATAEIKSLLSDLSEKDTVLIVVSGGGSTLLCQPNNFTCLDEREIIKELFAAGASIQELNVIRKHLSSARGGHLAALAYPAQVVGLIFSDVPGNDMGVVASGPTVYDETSVADAINLFNKFNLVNKIAIKPEDFLETPKNKEKFSRVENLMIVSNQVALEAMASKAEKLGFSSFIKANDITGESAVAAELFLKDLHGVSAQSCFLYGGETTVIGAGSGSGGRAQEISLAALSQIGEGELLLPFASDGRDNSEVAGAICDIITKSKAAEKNLSITDYLRRHDGLNFFELTGDTVVTGATGANVSDLTIALKQ